MKRLCFTLELKEDQQLIKEYIIAHQKIWPEITDSIRSSGILNMEIYCVHTRLFMIVDAADDFDPQKKAQLDASNPKVQEWEELMWRYQVPLPFADPGQKWVQMEKIFDLSKQ
jgi:L-rhamnose mutarotase